MTFSSFLSILQEIMFPFMKSFHHFKLRCGLTQKRGSERLLLFFPFWILESERKSSNSLFFTYLFRANITVQTRRNSTKKLYWLFTKEIIALTTSRTSLSRLTFYPIRTAIYVLVFLPSVASSHKRTSISLWNKLLFPLKVVRFRTEWKTIRFNGNIVWMWYVLFRSVRFQK